MLKLPLWRHGSVGFEVFTAMTMKNSVFWDVAPFGLIINGRSSEISVILRGIIVIMNDKCRKIGMGSITEYFQSQLLIPVAELKRLTQNSMILCFLAQSEALQMQVIRHSVTMTLSPFESAVVKLWNC
jgi:hypothetical protein